MHCSKKLAILALGVVLASCAGGPSGPRAPVSPKGSLALPPPPMLLQSVNLIVFPGGFNWPIWVAQERGFFARDGLEVELTPTPSSVFQLTNLIEGKFDIGMTAIDNVIAYQEGQGEAPVSVTPHLFAFMGGDNGVLR